VKEPEERSQPELEKLAAFLTTIKFFKERKIKSTDLADLSQFFKLVVKDKGEDAITYGEPGENFFIILKGQVEVLVPNSMIKGWRHERF